MTGTRIIDKQNEAIHGIVIEDNVVITSWTLFRKLKFGSLIDYNYYLIKDNEISELSHEEFYTNWFRVTGY